MSSLEPTSSSNIVEINGILFETLMPTRTIQVPQPGKTVFMKFGVRITNLTSTPYRFELPQFLPEILDLKGQKMKTSIGSNARRWTENEDIPLLLPDNTAEFWMNVELYYRRKSSFDFRGVIYYGSIWTASNFVPGAYQLQFIYENRLPQRQIRFNVGKTEIDNFWMGRVSTPSVIFNLSQLEEVEVHSSL